MLPPLIQPPLPRGVYFEGSAQIVAAVPQSQPTAIAASIVVARSGTISVATASSTTLTGTVYFFWYLDGIYVGQTTAPTRAFALTAGEQARIDCLASNDPDFDPVANAPAGWPARRMLVFTRSLDPGVVRYRIEQQANGGSWTILGFVQDDPGSWDYQYLTPSLTDLTNYAWRVIPIDAAGQDGTITTLGQEMIVRTPDAPEFMITFSSGTAQVTFSA